jgi:hypothetical protein
MAVKRVLGSLVVVAGVLLSVAATARCGEFLEGFCTDTLRNNVWPKPFVCPDRHAVRLPFHLMVQNGWRRENLLGEHHFRPGTPELTEAARLKVKWILREAPRHHRTIYVHTGESLAETAARIHAVQDLVVKLVPEGNLPPVLETSVNPPGWPASQVSAMGRKFQGAIPDPVLPAAERKAD